MGCEAIKKLSVKMVSGIIFFPKDYVPLSFIKTLDGSWAESIEEVLDTLMFTVHFPGHIVVIDEPVSSCRLRTIVSKIEYIFSRGKIK